MQESEGEINVRNREYALKDDWFMSTGDKSCSGLPSVEEAKKKFLQQAMPCPFCKTPPERLSWVYLIVTQWARKDLDRGKGWLTICDHCNLQINFFGERV